MITTPAGPNTAPAPTQPATPPVEIKKKNAFLAFIQDHWQIVAVGLVAVALFFVIPKFQEFAYGLLRIAIAVFFIALLIYVWFRDTIRQYLTSGAFVAEFRALEAKHRIAVTMTILVVVSWIVIECLVHP